jgi:phosphatidylglycerophosphatase A
MDHLATGIATAFYTGLIPLVPGLWGAGLGLLLWFLCRKLPLAVYVSVAVGLFALGVWAAGEAERTLGQPDAKPIVIDETLGIFLTLTGAARMRYGWLWGSLIFLALDVAKPFPASWLDAHLSGGLGIMLDDVVVGLYALLALVLWRRLVTQRPEPSVHHQPQARRTPNPTRSAENDAS